MTDEPDRGFGTVDGALVLALAVVFCIVGALAAVSIMALVNAAQSFGG